MFFKNLTYSKRQNIRSKLILFGALLAGILIATFFFWLGIKNTQDKDWAAVITGLLGMAMGFLYRPLYDKINARLAVYEDHYLEKIRKTSLGDKGEIMVREELRKILDNNYFTRSNFTILGQGFDIDEIVVGPTGLTILEIKNYKNDLIFSKEKLYARSDKGIFKYSKYWDPRNEATRHADSLRQYLNAEGFGDVNIRKAVVLVRENSAFIDGQKTGIFIINGVSRLRKYFDELPSDSSFDAGKILKLKTLLNK